MTAYIIRRLLMGFLVLILVSILIFSFMRLLPGDPLFLFVDPTSANELSTEARQALMHQYGLDQSLPLQYVSWMNGIFHGDLGKIDSYQWRKRQSPYRRPHPNHLLHRIVGLYPGVHHGNDFRHRLRPAPRQMD